MTARPVPPGFDIAAAPIVGTGRSDPPVPVARLRPAGLARQLAARAGQAPEWPGDPVPPQAGDALRPAAVLIGLIGPDEALRVLLTQRSPQLRAHAGQISFPGGRCDPQDASAWATALREAGEEVGLPPEAATPLAELPAYITLTGYRVTPLVARLQAPAAGWRAQAGEVADIFEVPLAHLMDPAQHQRRRLSHAGQAREVLALPWSDPDRPGQPPRLIWGATAAMLRNLYRRLAD